MRYFGTILTCLLFFANCQAQVTIWPGDANNNGTANHFDLLYICLGHGTTGTPRNVISNQWSAQTLQQVWPQATPVSVTNYGYLDCNGDGIINTGDLAAINDNFDLTHGTVIGDTIPPASGNQPQLFFQFPSDSIQAGATDTLQVMIGGTGTTITNLYGMAFTITFDTSLVDSVYTITDNSILSTPILPGVSISNYSKVEGKLDFSISQTNQSNIVVTGTAPVVELGIVMVDNLKSAAAVKTLNLGLQDAVGMSATENLIPVVPVNDSVQVYTGISESLNLRQHVSFSRQGEWFYAGSQYLQLQHISLLDMAGRTVGSEPANHAHLAQLNLSGLSSGLYILQLNTSKGTFSEKLIIK